MATVDPIRPKRRTLRTTEEIFAAGFEHGAKFPPLTEKQINICAALLAPVFNAPVDTERGAA